MATVSWAAIGESLRHKAHTGEIRLMLRTAIDRFLGPIGRSAATLAAVSVLGAMACEPPAAPRCTGPLASTGQTDPICSVGGRTYQLHVPASYTGQRPVALVIDMHGFTSTAQAQAGFSGWRGKSDAEGFIVAFPQGLNNSFNGQGACCGQSNTNNVDDVGFMRSIVTQLRGRGNIDPKRVYATGLSNGGSMSQTLACRASDVFTAVAPVSFPLSGGTTVDAIVAACRPPRPVTVVHFHGTADTVVPYQTGNTSLPDDTGAQQSLAAWVRIQQCDPNNVDTRFSSNTVCETHSNCTGGAKVTLCTVTGGDHPLFGSVRSSGTSIPDIAFPMLEQAAATIR
jgi:polyhydroxybutyrate depolymerase